MIPYEHWYIGSQRLNRPTAKERRTGRFVLLLISALILAIALSAAGCVGSKPPVDERPNAQLIAPPVAVDSSSKDASTRPPKIGLLARIFSPKSGFTAQKKPVLDASTSLPKKCKGCTFNVVAGNQTNSTVGKKATAAVGDEASATVIGKKAGPSITNSDSSTQAVTQGGAAAIGAGAHAEGGATVQEAAGFWGTLAKPLGYLACVVGAGAVVYLLYLIWAFLPRRKTNNQA